MRVVELRLAPRGRGAFHFNDPAGPREPCAQSGPIGASSRPDAPRTMNALFAPLYFPLFSHCFSLSWLSVFLPDATIACIVFRVSAVVPTDCIFEAKNSGPKAPKVMRVPHDLSRGTGDQAMASLGFGATIDFGLRPSEATCRTST